MSTLLEGLKRAAKPGQGAAKSRRKHSDDVSQSSRAGKVLIGGHFDPAVRSALLSIRVDHPEKTTQALLEEALDLLFERYKKPQAARVR